MTTPTDTEMIRDVAEGLGYPAWFTDSDGVEFRARCTLQITAFAAYVLAAMAKRGWRNFGSPAWSQDYSEVRFAQCQERPRKGTWAHKYDPTDPASWAMAVIRCAWEALKGDSND